MNLNFVEQDATDNPFLDDELFPTADAGDTSPPADTETHPLGMPPEQLQRLQGQAALMDRFATDPVFARTVLTERARQLGLQITDPQAKPASTGPSADYVAQVKASLSPELQFLAPEIAAATWTATEARIAPLQRQQEQYTAEQRQSTYDAMARELASEAPGWEQYEDEMLSILGFLRGAVQGNGPMTHQKYGSALKLLYRLASGDAQATATASRRMATAMRAGTSTSSGGGTRQNGPDLGTMIQQAKTSQQKWALAYNNALREHGVREN